MFMRLDCRRREVMTGREAVMKAWKRGALWLLTFVFLLW
jgi:hypothetical protein